MSHYHFSSQCRALKEFLALDARSVASPSAEDNPVIVQLAQKAAPRHAAVSAAPLREA